MTGTTPAVPASWLEMVTAGRRWRAVLPLVAVFAALVAASATVADRWNDAPADAAGPGEYALGPHVLASLTVGAVVVACVAGLRAADARGVGALVAVGAVVGPLSLTAPALQAGAALSLVWRAGIGAAELLLLWGCALLLAGRSEPEQRGQRTWLVFALALVAVWEALFVLPMAVEDPGHGLLGVQMVAGWAVLAAGMVAAAWVGRSVRRAGTVSVLAAAMLALTHAAYARDGGWPGVAGWVGSPGQSPILMTTTIGALLVVAPLCGWLAQRAAAALHPRTSPTTVSE